ncbi:hypothetical protein [Methylibium sp.]|uniref:hypothetical protein n=1 Tax=Methylibium sp. TaxID=2067992 RepID=UPI00185BC89C|nr:hypothetical protein [Methylibium sp.]MBA3588589.1 hypothetical protein [Methylibium sp.]
MANAPNDWDPRSEALLADQIAGYDAMRQRCLGLGFIVSMMMVHAPVILSAVARVKLQFGVFLYVRSAGPGDASGGCAQPRDTQP